MSLLVVRTESSYGGLGLEILEDCPEADVLVVCCGGGGLLAGTAAAVKAAKPSIRVIGVEPEGAPGMYLSRRQGTPASGFPIDTIAAGLAPPFAGAITFRHVQEHVDDLVLVTDSEIRAAMRTLYEDMGQVVEPSVGLLPCLDPP